QVFTNVPVQATDNIYGSGHSGADATPSPSGSGGGTPPTGYALSPGTGRILTFSSVTGLIDINGGSPNNGPDGTTIYHENVASFNGISGIRDNNRAAFLVGVFVGPTEPADPAPPTLSFSDAGDPGTIATS